MPAGTGAPPSRKAPEARLLVVDDEPNIRELLSANKRLSRTARQALGYKEVIDHLGGKMRSGDNPSRHSDPDAAVREAAAHVVPPPGGVPPGLNVGGRVSRGAGGADFRGRTARITRIAPNCQVVLRYAPPCRQADILRWMNEGGRRHFWG